jgi:peptide/nickel transport system substrate-binding protein
MTKRHIRLDRGSGATGDAGPEAGSKLSPRRLLVLVLTLAMVLAACGGDSGADDTTTTTAASGETTTTAAGETTTTAAPAEDDPRGTTLTYAYPQEPPNWNYWETGLSAVTAPLLLNVYETLVRMEADGAPVPLLAESWDVSDDGLTVTFNIRQGVTFHDGSELTSADVVYSMNMNAESGIGTASVAYAPVSDIQATDDYTVEVTLEEPSQSFLTRLADRAGIVVPENFFEDNDAGTTVIGTGPYSFGEYRIDQDLVLNRFDGYWGELPYFETVIQRFIPDETAALNALLGGEIDMVASVIGEGMDRVSSLADDPNLTVDLLPGTEVSYWALNTNVEVFQDIRVRQAIQHGHDRQSHIDAATAGTAIPSCTMAVPAGVAWDTDYCPYPYDPDRARELLEEAGATDLILDFPFANVAWHTVMAQIFQAEMAEIGITIELRSQDLATWLDQTNTQSQYEVFQITSGATIDQYGCGRNRQPFGREEAAFCDDTMDAMIAELDSILDRDEYIQAQIEIHEYVADQGWIFATKKPTTPVVYRSDLVGLKQHRLPTIHIDLRGLRWEG